MHITRIRSTKLDDWIVGDYKVLETVGNQIANLYWEHGLKGRSAPQIRGEDDRSSFIKSKYQSKLYAMKGKKDPVTVYLDSNYSLKQDDLREMYESEEKEESNHTKHQQKQTRQDGTSVRSEPKRHEESLIDFDLGVPTPTLPKPPQIEKAKSAVDPFGFDLFGEAKTPTGHQDPKPSHSSKTHHHDFTTSDFMFDFTKTTATFPSQSGHNHSAVNNGNVYNINNLTVLNQNFGAPQQPNGQSFSPPVYPFQTQQPPGINPNHGAHIDRYAVFDTFKLNYQHYNFNG
jgi:hypothetical protein